MYNLSNWINYAVIQQLGDAELQAMVDSGNLDAQLTVARYGSDKFKAKLIKHQYWRIREAIAWYGGYELIWQLVTDSDEYIARIARCRLGNSEDSIEIITW